MPVTRTVPARQGCTYARITYESDLIRGSVICSETLIEARAASLAGQGLEVDVETFEALDIEDAMDLVQEHEDVENLEMEPRR